MKKDTRNLLLVVGGLTVVGVGAYLIFKPKTPPALAGPSGAPLVTRNVILTPGTASVTVPANIGDTIAISLPSGAAWTAGGNLVPPGIVGTATPITFPYAGPSGSGGSLTWGSPNTGAQTTVITFQTGA